MQVEVPTVTVGSEEADITTGYEIVAVNITSSNATITSDSGVTTAAVSALSVAAPEGKKVVGGGYTVATGIDWDGNGPYPIYILDVGGFGGADNPNASSIITNGPASDGSAWVFSGLFGAGDSWAHPSNDPDNLFVWGTVYAICMCV